MWDLIVSVPDHCLSFYFARLWRISLRPTLPGTSTIIKFCMSCSMVSVKSAHEKETQLIQLVEDLSRQLIQGKLVDLVLLDFSKAFDKVSHLKLLFKPSQHGIRGNTLTWIKSFLVGLTQAVVLEGESSEEVPVNSGVPQGATPLFTIHKRPTP